MLGFFLLDESFPLSVFVFLQVITEHEQAIS